MKKSSKIVPAVEPSANEERSRQPRRSITCTDCTIENNSVDNKSLNRWLAADRRTSFRQSREYKKYIRSKRGKRDQENPPVTLTDFLRFLKQRTGWMGRNGCLVPPDFCHEYNDLERSPFSKALEKANDYLANQGLRPGMPAENRIMDIDNLPDELETLRVLINANGLVFTVQDFKNDLKQMLQLMNKRAENVRKAIDQQGTLEKLGLRLRPEHGSLWGSLRQYAFGETLARLLFHHDITAQEVNPIFAMMLFPLGGGTEHLSADYYTLGIHNPAVVQRVMRDAFVYMKKYHDIELIYYLPRIHGGLDLQARITQAVTRTGTVMFRQRGSRDALQLHPSWNGYISMVGRKNEKKKRGGSATPNPGEKCLTMLISKQEPWYCHDFNPSPTNDRTEFSLVLEKADALIFDAGLHPAFGILKDGKEVTMPPTEFVESMCEDGELPGPLLQLLPYCFDGGGEMCDDEFKRHLCEYVKLVVDRVPATQRIILKLAKTAYKTDEHDPKSPEEMLENCKRKEVWTTTSISYGLVLSEDNLDLWGSRRQYSYGRTVARLLDHYKGSSFKLNPMLAMMMNPTGGIVGPDNISIWKGDVQDAVVCHAIVHDAFGYLINFHGLGPGYNYLNVCDLLPSSSPFCCQIAGLARATQIAKHSDMMGTCGRIRRNAFMRLMTLIPSIQSHRELEQQLDELDMPTHSGREMEQKQPDLTDTSISPTASASAASTESALDLTHHLTDVSISPTASASAASTDFALDLTHHLTDVSISPTASASPTSTDCALDFTHHLTYPISSPMPSESAASTDDSAPAV